MLIRNAKRAHFTATSAHKTELFKWLLEAFRAPTRIFPAVFPMFVTCMRKKGILKGMKALELLNALYLLFHKMISQFSSAVPSFESGSETQCRSEETALKDPVEIYLELGQHLGVKEYTGSIINTLAIRQEYEFHMLMFWFEQSERF